jgi:hypothetical protein
MESIGRNDNSEYGRDFFLLTEKGCYEMQRYMEGRRKRVEVAGRGGAYDSLMWDSPFS